MKTIELGYKRLYVRSSPSEHNCECIVVAAAGKSVYLVCRQVQQPFSVTLHMFGRFDLCGFSKADTDILKLKPLATLNFSP